MSSLRYCPECGARMKTGTTSGSAIPRRYCPECGEL
ncbi:zinc ribbon domain-containing protein [Haloarcula montana]